MTQLPDILRTARPVAPPQLRERVRLITAPEPEPRRVRPWRRGALVLVPVALGAAVAAGVVVGLRDRNAVPQPVTFGSGVAVAGAAHSAQQTTRPTVLPPSTTRLQDYRASLTLQVRDANAVSEATKRAVRLAARLGGVVSRVDVSTSGTSGTAFIVLRVPEVKVTTALAQLGALGRILDQHVSVVDVQRRIDALRRQVRDTSGAARKAAQQQLFAELRATQLNGRPRPISLDRYEQFGHSFPLPHGHAARIQTNVRGVNPLNRAIWSARTRPNTFPAPPGSSPQEEGWVAWGRASP